MSRIYKLIFLPLFILGCKPNVIEEKKIIQRINNLDMNIFSMRGEKIYSITSPYSSFDKNQLKFQSKNTNINSNSIIRKNVQINPIFKINWIYQAFLSRYSSHPRCETWRYRQYCRLICCRSLQEVRGRRGDRQSVSWFW